MLSKALNHLFRLSRTQKRLIQLAVDTLLITVSFVLAMFLRLDSWAFLSNPKVWWVVPVVIPVSLFVFMRLGFYRAFIRYMSMQAAVAIGAGVFVSMVVMMVVNYLMLLPVPRSVPVIYAMMALLTIGGIRMLLRGLHQHGQLRYKTRVLVYGAGSSGRQLVVSLRNGNEYEPVAFVDDRKLLQEVFYSGFKNLFS